MRGLDVTDLHCERRYVGMLAYGRSKLANLLFALELHHRLTGEPVRTWMTPRALDRELQRRLWAESERVLDAGYAAFLREHLGRIESLFSPEQAEETKRRLRELTCNRAEELFG